MVITTPRGTDAARAVVAELEVAVLHDQVREHVPADVAETARAVAATHRVDVLLSVGGGSATGLAKAVALTTGLPIVAVPTTFAGSEATDIWGITQGTTKVTGTDLRVVLSAVVYDASLAVGLPLGHTVASGLNALAHAIDALWAPRAGVASTGLGLSGADALCRGLRGVVDAPRDLLLRRLLFEGTHLASRALSSAGAGLHHKVCHVLGGLFDLPHAKTHAVVLPRVVDLNVPRVPEVEPLLATALGALRGRGPGPALRRPWRAPRSWRSRPARRGGRAGRSRRAGERAAVEPCPGGRSRGRAAPARLSGVQLRRVRARSRRSPARRRRRPGGP